MNRSGTAALIFVLLAAFALLVGPGPVTAHTGPKALTTLGPEAPEIRVVSEPSMPAPAGLPDSLGSPAWLVPGALLLGVLVARGRPRRVLVLALVLLLTIFAFENALHSVHHGLDSKQYNECTIAAAAAHLSATSVDVVVEPSLALAVAGRTTDPDLSPPLTRLLGPDQGRAPPIRTA